MFGLARLQTTRNEQVPQGNLVHGSMVLPVASMGLCLVDEVVCVTVHVGLQLGVPLCEPHAHSTIVVNKCTSSPPMATVVPRARDAILSTSLFKSSLANYKAQFPSTLEPVDLSRTDGR